MARDSWEPDEYSDDEVMRGRCQREERLNTSGSNSIPLGRRRSSPFSSHAEPPSSYLGSSYQDSYHGSTQGSCLGPPLSHNNGNFKKPLFTRNGTQVSTNLTAQISSLSCKHLPNIFLFFNHITYLTNGI